VTVPLFLAGPSRAECRVLAAGVALGLGHRVVLPLRNGAIRVPERVEGGALPRTCRGIRSAGIPPGFSTDRYAVLVRAQPRFAGMRHRRRQFGGHANFARMSRRRTPINRNAPMTRRGVRSGASGGDTRRPQNTDRGRLKAVQSRTPGIESTAGGGLLPGNDDIASVLERVAALLEAQQAETFRVRAYRDAAMSIRREARSVASIAVQDGLKGLEELPAVGKSIASAIREYVATNRLGMLERLEGEVSPEDLLTTVPGIGEELAKRIHAELGVETLEDLELAAHDGRLQALRGFSHRRVQSVRDTLASMLGRSVRRRARQLRAAEHEHDDDRAPAEPAVSILLAVDAEYRDKARAGALRKITPRRFNPDKVAWLPVLHAERDGWSFTALFSNTARAHELGTTGDWVILYYERDGHEKQCTIVTERRGPLAGRRVVRGREDECRLHYIEHPSSSAVRIR
jgi:DNA polymerase (family X)